MPSLYSEGEYDMSGTIVGIVEKDGIVNGKNILNGDLLIGLQSSGLQTNGYSLARAALLEKYSVDTYFDEFSRTLGEELLSVHKSYLHIVQPLLEKNLLTGISHITGGGIVGNTSRILPADRTMEINWDSWQRLPIFDLIQKTGSIAEDEMRRVFNLGVGMILVARAENADAILEATNKANSCVIGRIK